MNRTPTPPKIVTADTHYSRVFKQVILVKSTAGRFINFTVNHRQWDYSIPIALTTAKQWLEKVSDTVSWLLLLDISEIDSNIRELIDKGIDESSLDKPLPSNQPLADFQPLMASSGSCISRQVTDIRQLEHYRSAYRMANDSMSWGDDIVTLTTLQGNYFTFASNYFHESSLVYVWEDTKKLRQYNGLPNNKHDPIVKILLTHKSCEKHYNIVKGHLEKKPLAVHYNAFVEPQATNTPPNLLQGQNGAIREQNKAINTDNNASNPVNHGNISPQTGKTHLNSLLFLLILVIFCLPFTHSMAYTKDLSKLQSDVPNRYPLAFFVPKICLDPQSSKPFSTKDFTQYSILQGKTIISKISNLSTAYDGLTLQNTIANRRICRAVSLKTESKTHHPMTFHSVVLTQNFKGGNHA